MCVALCGVNSKCSTRTHALEHLKDYTRTQAERKGKQWCRSLQLADWPKGFTLKLSQRAREGGREGETAGVVEGTKKVKTV